MSVRVGIVLLPQERWARAREKWLRAEAYGFDHAWTYDHLTWDPYAGRPWGATIPTLVAAAGVTSRIPLGTWVASPNYRHPVPFARELAGDLVERVADGVLEIAARHRGHALILPCEGPLWFCLRLALCFRRFHGASDVTGVDFAPIV